MSSDLRYFDGVQWVSLKGADGDGAGVSMEEVNNAIDAALDPYLLIADFNTIIANYATKADLANYITVATADSRYVQLNPAGNAAQNITGGLNVRRDLFLYADPISKTGPRLEISSNPAGLNNVTRIMSRDTTGARQDILLEPNGDQSFVQLGGWNQSNQQTTSIQTRYVRFTQGLVNSGPAPIFTDAQTGKVNAYDFFAENGVETARGPNLMRGATYMGVAQGQPVTDSKFVVLAAQTPHTRIRGTGVELSAVIANFTNAQQPIHRRASDNLLGYFSSSERFKQQITPADELADKTLIVEPVKFFFNEDMYEEGDPHYEQMGFIAEDVVNNFGPGAGV
jgi:hypothetical protein